MSSDKLFDWVVAIFLAVLVVIVFYQINTSMMEQGIATGGPYDNGASYPRTIAIIIAALVGVQLLISGLFKRRTAPSRPLNFKQIKRPVAVLLVFTLYVSSLTMIGYHLSTAPMIFALMWVCGARHYLKQALAALAMAFIFAYLFEKILNVVLPGGIFSLNIPW